MECRMTTQNAPDAMYRIGEGDSTEGVLNRQLFRPSAQRTASNLGTVQHPGRLFGLKAHAARRKSEV